MECGKRLLLSRVEAYGSIQAAKRDIPLSLKLMTGRLKAHAGQVGLAVKGYTLHCFRGDSAVSRELNNRTVFEIMQRIFWKSENVARR